jgi:hypothetical protein
MGKDKLKALASTFLEGAGWKNSISPFFFGVSKLCFVPMVLIYWKTPVGSRTIWLGKVPALTFLKK